MLELRDVKFRARAEKKGFKDIINDVSLTMENNSLTVLTGPNGGGKTTLAKIIVGIEKPSSGQVLLDGEDITGMSITDRANCGIGFAFQQPVRFKGLTVKDLIQMAASRPMTTEDVCHYLAEVGLCAADYVDRDLDASLSGGEMKRIEIAMLIARNTRFSVFDEPEAGIDLWSFHNLIKVFEKMRLQTDGSILIISHQERILDIADKIVIVSDGRIKQAGTREEILPALLEESQVCDYYKGDA